MRLEKVIARALEKVNDNHYVLSIAIAQRAKEFANGEKPLNGMDLNKHKFTDIALHEIADGVLIVDGFVEEE